MKNTKKYETGSPEQCLANFLTAWQKRNWTEMPKYCQKSWIPKNEVIDNRDLLRRQRIKLGQPPLTDAEMESVEPFIEVSAEAQLKSKFGGIMLKLSHIDKVFMDDGLDAKVITDAKIVCHYQTKDKNGRWIKQILVKTFQFRLVKEIAPRQPSVHGEWGVNPNSFRIL